MARKSWRTAQNSRDGPRLCEANRRSEKTPSQPLQCGREDFSVARTELVDLVGIEPTTSSMPWKRAPKLRHRPTCGGVQLSYCLRRDGIRQTGRRKAEPGGGDSRFEAGSQ